MSPWALSPMMTVSLDCTHLSIHRVVLGVFPIYVPWKDPCALDHQNEKFTLFHSCRPSRGQCGGRHCFVAGAPQWGWDLAWTADSECLNSHGWEGGLAKPSTLALRGQVAEQWEREEGAAVIGDHPLLQSPPRHKHQRISP